MLVKRTWSARGSEGEREKGQSRALSTFLKPRSKDATFVTLETVRVFCRLSESWSDSEYDIRIQL